MQSGTLLDPDTRDTVRLTLSHRQREAARVAAGRSAAGARHEPAVFRLSLAGGPVVFDMGTASLMWGNVMLPGGGFEAQMSELVRRIKATPRQPGVDEIRIPSERARRERERRRNEGIVLDRKVFDALNAL